MMLCHRNDLRCASPSAIESGLFCLLFVAVDKKEVAEGRTKIKKVELSPHAFDKQRKSSLSCVTSVSRPQAKPTTSVASHEL